MKNKNIKSLFKSFLIIFILAALVSLLTFYFYNTEIIKEEINLLGKEEEGIISRCKTDGRKFRFCAYPETDCNSRIAWENITGKTPGECLKLTFRHNKKKDDLIGIHTYLSLNSLHMEKSSLELRLKVKGDYSQDKILNIYLKGRQNILGKAEIYLKKESGNNWRKINLPIDKFFLLGGRDEKIREGINLSSEIQEILFSVNTVMPNEFFYFLIDSIKITDGKNVIYEIL